MLHVPTVPAERAGTWMDLNHRAGCSGISRLAEVSRLHQRRGVVLRRGWVRAAESARRCIDAPRQVDGAVTEATQVKAVARRYLAPYIRLVAIEGVFAPGVPDFYYCGWGVSGWCEAKLIPTSGRRPDHFTLDQLLWGEAEIAAGGLWHLLGRSGAYWIMYDALGARAWYEGAAERWLFRISGRFPLREVLDRLAPRDRRIVNVHD